jgi:hypothetical protein
MAIAKPQPDFSSEFNSLYKITQDMSGWSKTAIQVVAPINGAIIVYASNDANAVQGVQFGNAKLAINFSPILVTNLATGTTTNSISAAGIYKADVDAQFLRLQGTPAAAGTNVYKLLLFHSKVD